MYVRVRRGAGLSYEPHGVYALKGVPGEWVLHRAIAR